MRSARLKAAAINAAKSDAQRCTDCRTEVEMTERCSPAASWEMVGNDRMGGMMILRLFFWPCSSNLCDARPIIGGTTENATGSERTS